MQTLREEKGPPLPLSSLRLFVPPLRLVCAALWQVVERRDVMDYGLLEEFATSVLEIVPDLMTYRERVQLLMGLRARLVLELCRCDDELCRPDTVQPHLNRIRNCVSNQKGEVSDPKVEASEASFMKLIETLLEQPEERELFFQILVWEFLSRLEKLIPAPNLKQSVAHPEPLQAVLRHHKNEHHLDTNALRSTGGDYILSSLSFPSSVKEEIASYQAGPEKPSYPTMQGYQTLFPCDEPGMSWDCRMADCRVWTVNQPAVSASVEVEVKTIEDATEITVKRKTINKEMIKETRRDKAVLCPQTRSGLKTSRLTASCLRRQPVLRLNRLDISNMPLPKSLLTLILRRGRLQAETRRPGPKGIDRKKKRRRGRGKKLNHQIMNFGPLSIQGSLSMKGPLTMNLREEEQPIQTFHSEEHSGHMAEAQNREELPEMVPQDSLTPEPSNTSHKIHSEEHSVQLAEAQNREELPEMVPQDSLTPEPPNTSHKIHSEEHSVQLAEAQNREELPEMVPQDSLTPEPPNTSHKIHSEEHSVQMAEAQNREELPEMVPQDSLTPEPPNTSHKIHSEEHSVQMAKAQNREELPEMVPQDSLTPEPSNTSHKINSEEHSGHMFEAQNREELPEMVPQDLLTPEPSNTSHKIHSEEHSVQMAEAQNREELPEMVPQDSLTPEPSNTSHKINSDEHSGHMAEGQNVEIILESVPNDLLTEIVLQDSLTPEPSNSSHKRSQRVKACSFCGKTFTDTLGLTRHMRSHIEQRSHQCTQCGQDYESSEDLEEHQKSSCEEKIKKDSGGETVQQKTDLKRDKKPDLKADNKPDLKGQTKGRAIKCHVCGKITTRMLGLRRHLLLHFNNGAYKCPVCPTTFITNADLRSHLRLKRSCREKCSDEVINTKVHLQSNPGEYKCPYCGDTFQLPHDLKGHTKDCSRKCHVCGKTTLKPCGMRRHMLRHTNNGPYKCPVCPRTFISHTDLKMHLKKNKQCREKCSDVMQSDNSRSSDVNLNSLDEDYSQSTVSQYQPMKDVDLNILHDDYSQEISQNQPITDVDLNCLHEASMMTTENYSDEISQYQPMKDVDPEKDRKSVNDSGVNEMPNDKEPISTNGLTGKQVSQTDPRPLQDSQPETSGESGKLHAEATGSHGQKRRGRKRKQKRGHGDKNEKTETKGVKRERSPETEEDAKPPDNKLWTTVIKRTTVSDSDKKPDLKGHTKDGSIKCHVCGKITTRIVSLQRHLLLHFNNGAYKCPVCPKTFILNCDLRSHLKLKRSCGKKCSDKVIITRLHLKSNPGDYKCPYCGDTFQLPYDLKGHTKDCSRKSHVCGKTTSRMMEMRRHMLKHKNNGPIKCPVCPKTFVYHTNLKKHLKTKKLCREKCSDMMVKDNADLKLPRRLKRSYSKKCSDKVITTKLHLKSNPGDYKCPYCGDTFQLPRDLKGHTKDCSRKCHVCGKITSTARGMRRHMLRHNNNGTYKCPVCPRTFIYHPDLKKHLKLKKRCRAKCSDVMMKELLSSGYGRCRKMLNETRVITSCQQPSSSNTGGPSKSIEELSHDSQQSENSMSSDMNLISLEEDHSDEISQYQPIKDVDLNRLHEDFSDEISQYQPIKDVNQSNPGEYKCPYCGDTFQLPDDLKGHTKDCSRKCHVCGKISSKACDMRRHMLKHDNNGPIKCPVCPKTFIFHTDLKTHLKTKKLCREKYSDVMATELPSSVDGRCRTNVNETGVMTRCEQPSSSNTGGPSKSGPVLGLKSFDEFFEELSNDSDISMSSEVNMNSLYEDFSQEISQYQPIKDVGQSNPGEYKCPYCGETFQLPRDLKRHKKDCSRKCHVCGKTTSTACGMRRHMLKHYNGPINCPVCPTTFVYHTDLKKHLKTKKLCREKCSDVMAKELLSSVDGRCRTNVNETGEGASCQQPSSSDTGGPSKSIEEFSHDTQQSDNSMSSDVNLNSLHEDNSQEISQYQPIKDIDQSNPGEYKCPYCGDTFQQPDDLKGHTKDCSRKCQVCGKISSKACDMRRHMLKHYNNGPIKCLVCPKTFIFHTDLKTHLKTKKLCREKCSDEMAKELLSSVDGICRKTVNETGVMTRCQQPSSSNTGGPSKSGPVLGLKSFEEFFEELSNDSDISMSSDVNLNSLHEDYSQEISQYQPMKDVDLNILHEDYSQEISQYHPMKDTDLNSLHEDYSQEIGQYQPMKDVDLNSLHEVYSDDISQYQPVKDIDPKEDRMSVNDSGVNEMPNDKEPNSTNGLTGKQVSQTDPRPLQDSI
ncbi:unnamed protein product [Coregonus sp. 'balchen']|nr:unnamed protein product [Coregonus sp. 'balchen']